MHIHVPVSRGLTALAAISLTLVAPAAATTLPTKPLDDAGYWALADATQERLDRFWNRHSDSYRVGGSGADPAVNGQLLYAHAVAARTGHTGATRNDERARLIALRLVTGNAPFVEAPGNGSHGHAPGFTNSMNDPRGEQHLVFDAQVIDGLAAAWRARRELDLPESTSELIADRLHRIAHGSYWRYPAIRLNQISWYGLVYAAAATVAGDEHLLRRDLRLQIERFVRGVRRGGGAGNLGPGGRFHYLPHLPVAHPMNVDSAEYANIVIGVTRFLDRARAAGMRISRRARTTFRSWARRVIAGYWTHAGYLNWDTGLGFARWHQAKKLGLSQEALVGLAQDDTLGLPRAWRRWAKHILDAGLVFYERWSRRERGIPAPIFFGVHAEPQSDASGRLAAARMVANAAKAVEAGLGQARASTPPPLYAYDPDIGRLAVTTPHYNTAVIAVNQGAFPYGGIELARLFDGQQDVAGSVAGKAPAAFGVVVRDRHRARVFATQVGRSSIGRTPSLRLLRGGTAMATTSTPGRVYAGRFRTLRATGTHAGAGLFGRTTHTFTARSITTSWTLTRTAGRRALDAHVMFPSHGPRGAITGVLRDGRRIRLGRTAIPLARIRAIHVQSQDSGYSVRVGSHPRGAVAVAQAVRAQPSAPLPGPSLALRVARGTSWRRAQLVARVTPQPGLALHDRE